MAKGYWLAQVEVTDLEATRITWRQTRLRFANIVPAMVRGRHEAVEGACRSRLVVIEFPDYEAALACYRSPEYQHAITLRQGHAVADIAIVEGYDGPQP